MSRPQVNPNATAIDELRLIVDGRTTIVHATNDLTALFSMNGRRCAIAGKQDGRMIELTTVAPDEDRVSLEADARVREAAGRPKTPHSDRPSVLQASVRRAAREYHAATWQHGYSQCEAEYSRKPLNERVVEADVPALVELVMAHVLSSPELRESLLNALAATEVEALLV